MLILYISITQPIRSCPFPRQFSRLHYISILYGGAYSGGSYFYNLMLLRESTQQTDRKAMYKSIGFAGNYASGSNWKAGAVLSYADIVKSMPFATGFAINPSLETGLSSRSSWYLQPQLNINCFTYKFNSSVAFRVNLYYGYEFSVKKEGRTDYNPHNIGIRIGMAFNTRTRYYKMPNHWTL